MTWIKTGFKLICADSGVATIEFFGKQYTIAVQDVFILKFPVKVEVAPDSSALSGVIVLVKGGEEKFYE